MYACGETLPELKLHYRGANWLRRSLADELFAPGQPLDASELRTESATRIQELAPTRAAADKLYEERLAQAAKGDANDALWAIEAIMDYNLEPDLDKITAKVLLINAEEDEANPPELGTVERAMKRVRQGRYVLIPAGAKTHGHFTHFYAEVWKPHLIEFMRSLGTPLDAAAE